MCDSEKVSLENQVEIKEGKLQSFYPSWQLWSKVKIARLCLRDFLAKFYPTRLLSIVSKPKDHSYFVVAFMLE